MADVQAQQVSQDDPRSVTVAALFADGGNGEFLGNATILSRNLAVAPSSIFLSRLIASRAKTIREDADPKIPSETRAFPPMSLAFLRYQPTPRFYSLPVAVQIIDQELGFAVLSFSGELPLPLSPDLLEDGAIPPPRTECEALYYEAQAQVLIQVSGQVSNRSESRFRLRLSPNATTPAIGAPVLKGNQVVGMVTSVPPAAFESNSLSDPFPFVEVLGLPAMAESKATPAVRNLLPWIKGDANPFTGFRPGPSAQSSSEGVAAASEITDAELLARLGSSGLRVLERAVGMRVQVRQGAVDTLHMEYLIAGLFDSLRGFFAAAKIDGAELRRIIRRTVGTVIPSDYRTAPIDHLPPLSEHVREALLHALRYADEHAADKILSTHLLYGALSVTDCRMIQVLNEYGILRENIREADVSEDNDRASHPSNTAKGGPASAVPASVSEVSEMVPEHLGPLLETSLPIPPPFGRKMQFPGYTDSPLAANPTPKVASDLWSEKDSLGYEAYARTIASLITHEETKPPLTIGIKAPWGAGKTSLMKRVQHLLDGYAGLAKEGKVGILQDMLPTQVTLRELLNELKDSGTKPSGPAMVESKEGKAYGLAPRITVWFNAWKYQTSEQIWAGMAHCIISQVTARMGMKDRELFWLRLHGRRVNVDEVRKKVYGIALQKLIPLMLLVLAGCVIAFVVAAALPIGVPLRYVIRGASLIWASFSLRKEWGNKLGEKAAGAVRELIREPDYEGKMGYLHLVESDIRDVLQLATESSMTEKKQSGDPLVVFVDDLDRCAPNKVAEVVEAINLFLCGDYPNCIFVLGMEPGMVAAALEVANKDVIEKAEKLGLVDRTVPLGWRFMEKIVQLPIMIPPPTKGGKEAYVRSLTGVYEANAVTANMFPELPSTPRVSAPAVNMAGVLGMGMEGASIGKVLRDEVKAREIELAPLNEDEVNKYAEEMKGKTLAEVQAKSEEILAKIEPEKRRAAAEASKRVYAQTFSERDPAMAEFVQEVAELVDGNPRQIKRYVNVFRFYSTLRHSLQVDRTVVAEEVPSDKLLAKFVALSIHWPHAVDCLRVKKDAKSGAADGRRMTLLEILEAQSRKEVAEGESADAVWELYVGEKGLNLQPWVASRAFREFLARGESLCGKEGHGLW